MAALPSVTPRQGLVAAFLAVCCWSGFVLVSRLGGISVLTPYDTIALRYGVGALVLLPFLRRDRLWLNWRGLALALTGGIGYSVTVYLGFKYTSAIHAGVMLPGLIPFGAALFCFLLLGERLSRVRSIGLLLIAAAGALMLSNQDGDGHWLGDAWLLVAVVCWSLYTVLVRRWQVPPWTGAITTAYLTVLMFLPVYLLWLPQQLAAAPWPDLLLQGFYQGVIATVVAMLCYLRGVMGLGASGMGALMALVPVLSGVAAVPLLGEALHWGEALAMVLACLGAVLAAGIIKR